MEVLRVPFAVADGMSNINGFFFAIPVEIDSLYMQRCTTAVDERRADKIRCR